MRRFLCLPPRAAGTHGLGASKSRRLPFLDSTAAAKDAGEGGSEFLDKKLSENAKKRLSIIKNSNSGVVIEFDDLSDLEKCVSITENHLNMFIDGEYKNFESSNSYMEKHSAKQNTKSQTDFLIDHHCSLSFKNSFNNIVNLRSIVVNFWN